MVTKITCGIKISVETSFQGTFVKDQQTYFAFSYEITIENQSNDTVQLLSRYWEIFDSLKNKEEVIGEGVVGLKPVIKPGEKHIYSSGCILSSPIGSMKGFYKMINFSSSSYFQVDIPNFKLMATFAMN